MLDWIANSVTSFTEWLGGGVASAVEWLLGGLAYMFMAIINAADGIWSVFESLWNLGTGFIGSLLGLVSLFFPFVPEAVSTVISAGLLAVLIAGIVKKVRGQ